MSVPAFSRVMWPWAVGGLVLGCGGTGPMAPVSNVPPEVGSVRLFAQGGDVTDHIALGEGQTLRIEVRLYEANGARILPAAGDVAVQLTFDPPTFATALPVPGSPLLKDVTPTAAPLTHGGIHVTCEQTDLMITKGFGPFEALIH